MKNTLLRLLLLVGTFVFFTSTLSAATLTLSPASANVTVGDIFSVQVLLNAQGALIDGVDIYRLNFNPLLLEVQDENAQTSGVQIAPGILMPNTGANSADNTLGKIVFAQLANPGTTYTNSSNAVLATVRFKAKTAGQALVTFDFTSGSTVDTNVISSGADVLTSVVNGSYALETPQDTTAPTITNVTSAQITQTSAMITWTTDEPSTSQVDFGLTTAYGSSSALDTTQVSSHSISLAGLSAGTLYNYRVRSRDTAGNESVSTNQTFTTQSAPAADTTAPARVTSLSGSNITETSVDVSWTAPGDDEALGTAASYDIRYSTTPITDATWPDAAQATGEPAPKASGSSESFSLVGLSSNTQYSIALRVRDEAGNISPISNVITITTAQSPGTPPPPEPKIILTAPSPGQCFEHGAQVNISWTIENADHAALYVTEDGGASVPDFGSWFFMQDAGQSAVTSYVWTVPNNITSDTVRIYAEAHNASHASRLAIDALDANISLQPSCVPAPPPPAPAPAPAPASPSGGGGGGGGYYAPSDTTPPPKITDFSAQGADKQVILRWKNPSYTNDWVRTLVVKKQGGPSTSPSQGAIVYQGTGEEYTDTDVQNGALYYYSAFTLDRVPNYSQAVLISSTPVSGVTSVPVITQKPSDFSLENMGRVAIYRNTLYVVFSSGEARPFETPEAAQSFGILAPYAQTLSDSEFQALILKEAITLQDKSILKSLDTDGDTLSNFREDRLGTDPYNIDTDADGFTDDVEVKKGFDPINPPSKKTATATYIARLKGRILLQVKRKGEAWYVYPKDGKRYYLRDGEAAYMIMRFLGEGIRTKNLERIPDAVSKKAGDYSLVQRMKGKILLQVDKRGEAWYINPKDGKRYYMKDGAAAYEMMRKFGLGAITEDITQIPFGLPPAIDETKESLK